MAWWTENKTALGGDDANLPAGEQEATSSRSSGNLLVQEKSAESKPKQRVLWGAASKSLLCHAAGSGGAGAFAAPFCCTFQSAAGAKLPRQGLTSPGLPPAHRARGRVVKSDFHPELSLSTAHECSYTSPGISSVGSASLPGPGKEGDCKAVFYFHRVTERETHGKYF